jgi:predicted nucleic acid-binding protein
VIAYFDSSSIVKWFFDEPYAELARETKSKAETVFTSLLAFPEVLSAINRVCKEGRCFKSEMEQVRNEFLRIWPNFRWIKVSEEVMQQAGELIFNHSLRAFDAVHLASALLLKQESGAIDVFFSCFDQNLNQAAREEDFFTHQAF